jgi:alpha-tubulin suppressor-like RCC1 family protein
MIVWGFNFTGQLGAPRSTNWHPFPTLLPFHKKVKKVACTKTATVILDINKKVYVTGQLCRGFECKYGFEEIPLSESVKDIFTSNSGSVMITTSIGAYGFGLTYFKNLGLDNTNRPRDEEYYYVLEPEKIKELKDIIVENIVMGGAFTYIEGKVDVRNNCNLMNNLKRTLDSILTCADRSISCTTVFKFNDSDYVPLCKRQRTQY